MIVCIIVLLIEINMILHIYCRVCSTFKKKKIIVVKMELGFETDYIFINNLLYIDTFLSG